MGVLDCLFVAARAPILPIEIGTLEKKLIKISRPSLNRTGVLPPSAAAFIACASIFFASCGSNLPLDQSIKLKLSVDVAHENSRLPDLTLLVSNGGKFYPELDSFFWGNLVVSCGSNTWTLGHRFRWAAMTTGRYPPLMRPLKPGEVVRVSIRLQDFMTQDDFREFAFRDVVAGNREWVAKWMEHIHSFKILNIHCSDPESGRVSNTIAIPLEPRPL